MVSKNYEQDGLQQLFCHRQSQFDGLNLFDRPKRCAGRKERDVGTDTATIS